MLPEKGYNHSKNAPGRNHYECKKFYNRSSNIDPVTKVCTLTFCTLRLEIRRKFLEQFTNKGVEGQITKSAKKKPNDFSVNFIIMHESCL